VQTIATPIGIKAKTPIQNHRQHKVCPATHFNISIPDHLITHGFCSEISIHACDGCGGGGGGGDDVHTDHFLVAVRTQDRGLLEEGIAVEHTAVPACVLYGLCICVPRHLHRLLQPLLRLNFQVIHRPSCALRILLQLHPRGLLRDLSRRLGLVRRNRSRGILDHHGSQGRERRIVGMEGLVDVVVVVVRRELASGREGGRRSLAVVGIVVVAGSLVVVCRIVVVGEECWHSWELEGILVLLGRSWVEEDTSIADRTEFAEDSHLVGGHRSSNRCLTLRRVADLLLMRVGGKCQYKPSNREISCSWEGSWGELERKGGS